MKQYVAKATKVNEDGSEDILRGEASDRMYDAYRTLKGWTEALGDSVTGKEIEVYGKARKLYTIHVTGGEKDSRPQR